MHRGPDAHWYCAILGQEWLNQSVLDSHSVLSTLTNALNHHPAQLLLGVHAHSAPDHGLLRQLDSLAQAAQGGVLVQL